MAQRKMSELPSKFKVAVISGGRRVEAPLPPDFGMTVGSEYTTPLDTMAMSGTIQKAYVLGGLSQPVGLRMRKMYSNPEPTELSFDMTFDAYYSAKEEVAIPVITLMIMALGRVVEYQDVENALRQMAVLAEKGAELTASAINLKGEAGQISEGLNGLADQSQQGNRAEYGSKVMEMISLIKSPEMVTLKFGDFITIDNAYITSTGVQFSNVLDKDGFPMSAKVSVTCTLQVAPVADDIVRMFGNVVSVR